MTLPEHLHPAVDPVADEAAVVRGPGFRCTVLTPRIVRLEYDPDESFEDRASQLVWDRTQPVPEFASWSSPDGVRIETEYLTVRYDPDEPFGPESLSATFPWTASEWHYGDEPDAPLGGGLRTLDRTKGSTDIEPGLLARDGWTVVDDTDSLVFGDDGWVGPRETHEAYEDWYLIAYGHDYLDALADFTAITGDVPLLPRWALGNWWSRYREFTQAELRDLMEQFREHDLPLSVCMIDMDWHVIDNPYTGGWTGWTWNRDLFTDPPGFIEWLHDNGLRTGLNIHPAGGVHPHEVQYDDFAAAMGIDPASEHPVEFDAADAQFWSGYFEHLIEPIEDVDGVDFWWIDWQQWDESPELEGLDPLWALNHLHALDRTRTGKRPFVLSRWPGLGGHRYPVGFSGDAVIDWESLQFQPYLTAAGSNVQFDWSHDVGGHFGGTGAPGSFGELFARWTQFGAFSPINRIHTGDIPYLDKRPWAFESTIFETIADAMRTRHALIPYTYTMAWRHHAESVPLVRPMYYHEPTTEAAYHAPQQYYFGSELLAAPHVRPRHAETNLARQTVWLPDGPWFDVRSGERYDEGFHARYGDLGDLPVYAKAGAIVPMGPDVGWGGIDPPETLRVLAFPGADNGFALYEDDGDSLAYADGDYAMTPLGQTWEGDWCAFEIDPVEGNREHVPDERDYELHFRGVRQDVEVTVDRERVDQTDDSADVDPTVSYDAETATLIVELEAVEPHEDVSVYLDTAASSVLAPADHTMDRLREVLTHLEIPARTKQPIEDHAASMVAGERDDLEWLNDFAEVMTPEQVRAIVETLCDVGIEHLDHTDDERLLLWNGEDRCDAVVEFRTFDRGGVPLAERGTSRREQMPAFEIVAFEEWARHDWTLTVEYAGITAATFEGEGEAPQYEGLD